MEQPSESGTREHRRRSPATTRRPIPGGDQSTGPARPGQTGAVGAEADERRDEGDRVGEGTSGGDVEEVAEESEVEEAETEREAESTETGSDAEATAIEDDEGAGREGKGGEGTDDGMPPRDPETGQFVSE